MNLVYLKLEDAMDGWDGIGGSYTLGKTSIEKKRFLLGIAPPHIFVNSMNFDVPKKRTKLPELGSGGGGVR